MAKSIGLALFTLSLFLFGVVLLVFPRRLQGFAAYWAGQGLSGKFPFIRAYVESDAWITYARLAGAMALAMSIFLLVAGIKSRAF